VEEDGESGYHARPERLWFGWGFCGVGREEENAVLWGLVGRDGIKTTKYL